MNHIRPYQLYAGSGGLSKVSEFGWNLFGKQYWYLLILLAQGCKDGLVIFFNVSTVIWTLYSPSEVIIALKNGVCVCVCVCVCTKKDLLSLQI